MTLKGGDWLEQFNTGCHTYMNWNYQFMQQRIIIYLFAYWALTKWQSVDTIPKLFGHTNDSFNYPLQYYG